MKGRDAIAKRPLNKRMDMACNRALSCTLVQFCTGCRFCNSAWNRHLFRCYVYSRKRKGFSIHNRKNRTMREKERENFGTDDDKNFSAIVSKIKDKHL